MHPRPRRLFVFPRLSISFPLPFRPPHTESIHDSPSVTLVPFPCVFIFFQPLPHGALPVPGLCRGLGGKRVGLAIIPAENREPFASSNYLKFPFDISRGTGNFIWPWLALSPQWHLSLSYEETNWPIAKDIYFQKFRHLKAILDSFAKTFDHYFWSYQNSHSKLYIDKLFICTDVLHIAKRMCINYVHIYIILELLRISRIRFSISYKFYIANFKMLINRESNS